MPTLSGDTPPASPGGGERAPRDRLLAVVGAGVMGTGIAALATSCGLPVVLVEVDPARLEAAPGEVRHAQRAARLLGGLPAQGPPAPLTTTAALGDIVGATAVVECVPERPALKREVLAAISAVVAAGTPVTSNTSAIPVAELAAATARPADVVGTHFMNPPHLIRTVEVVRGPLTSDAAMAGVGALLASLGREAILVGDGPGFVSNRILMRTINEAARIVGDGIANAAAVDGVLERCFGHRMGPLATADLIGLDNVVDTLDVLYERTGDAAYLACEPLRAAVAEGRYGRKTGAGFHDYAKGAR